jgi:ABC-type transport system involved in multi-copper enzyme maturation permease subunit
MISAARIARLTGIEVAKMRRQRLAQVVVLVPVAAAALIPLALSRSGREGVGGFLALATSLELSLLLASFLILIQSALAVSWDRSEKTLREPLAGPVLRSEIVLSRWLALELELVLLLLLVALAALATTSALYSFEDITAGAIEPLFYASELRDHTLLGLAYHVPAAAALVTLGLLISVLAGTPAMAAALAAGSLLVLDVGKSLFSGASAAPRYLFNSYLPTLFDRTSYLHGVTQLSQGVSDVLWSEDSDAHRLVWLVSLGYAGAFLVLSVLVFTTRDYAE